MSVTKPSEDLPTPSSRASVPRRVARSAKRAFRLVLLIYLGVCAVLYAFQTRLIFPGAASRGTPEAIVRPRPGTDLVTLGSPDGRKIVALFGPALNADGSPCSDAISRPTILFFYGNGMYLSAAEPNFESLRRLGANVLIPDYLGYGMSEGEPGEAGCLATADAALEHLLSRPDVDPDRILAVGWSLGGGVAIDLAARRQLAGLVVLSGFTSLVDMAKQVYPFLPASLLLAHRFDNLSKISRVSCPILIGHGARDPIVPPSMSDRLAAAARTPARNFKIEGVGHNDLFDDGWPALRAELLPFLEKITRARPSRAPTP